MKPHLDLKADDVTTPGKPSQRARRVAGQRAKAAVKTVADEKKDVTSAAPDDQVITPTLVDSNKIAIERLLIYMIVPAWVLLLVLAALELVFGNPDRWAIGLMLSGAVAPLGAVVTIIVRHYFRSKG